MDRYNLNVVDEPDFTTEESDNLHIQADMTRQVIEFVQTKRLTLKSAANLFKINETTLGQVMKGRLDVLSDD